MSAPETVLDHVEADQERRISELARAWANYDTQTDTFPSFRNQRAYSAAILELGDILNTAHFNTGDGYGFNIVRTADSLGGDGGYVASVDTKTGRGTHLNVGSGYLDADDLAWVSTDIPAGQESVMQAARAILMLRDELIRYAQEAGLMPQWRTADLGEHRDVYRCAMVARVRAEHGPEYNQKVPVWSDAANPTGMAEIRSTSGSSWFCRRDYIADWITNDGLLDVRTIGRNGHHPVPPTTATS